MKLSSLSTRIFFGTGVVAADSEVFSNINRAFIVTGKHGARSSGALDDVVEALNKTNAEYILFDGIVENPPADLCRKAGERARDFDADAVIAIGGGSAIDGAKAIAAYATNVTLSSEDIFDPAVITSPGLPLIAIPTTAGTGSEVNSFSILTIDGGRKKRTFKNQWSTPICAFVDPQYTYSLSREYSLSCALDAFAHTFESYLSPKSTDETRSLAAEAAKLIWHVLLAHRSERVRPNSDQGGFTPDERAILMLASNLAGQVIGITGTGFPHPLGYNLTMAKGIPHGRACAAFYSEYLRFNYSVPEGKELLDNLCSYIGTDCDSVANMIPNISPVELTLTEEEIADFVNRTKSAANYANSPYVIDESEMLGIYRKLFA